MKLALLTLALAAVLSAQSPSVTLTWTDTLNPPSTQYNVYRATGACAPTGLTFSKRNATPIAPKTYTETGVPGGTYCYYVTATDGALESAPSTTAAAGVPPSAPGGLSISVTVTVTVP